MGIYMAHQESIKREVDQSPLEAIKACMKERGLNPRDLIPYIGSQSGVYQILLGKRGLSMPMARALHKHLGIPAEILLREPVPGPMPSNESTDGMRWDRFPLKVMVKRGWIPDGPNLAGRSEELLRGLIDRAQGGNAPALYRKNDQGRINAKVDPYALKAWCWQVMATANERLPVANYEPGVVTLDFLNQVAQLSRLGDGPRHAKDLLEEHGIPLVILPHLPRTYLDGAALRLQDGRPVIGLTLRYDRIDNFWFCLLHELAHVGRHLNGSESDAFIDDLTLRKSDGRPEDPREAQADEWAEEALIPSEVWEATDMRNSPTAIGLLSLANELKIHPAIIAGRIRFEQKNYRLLSQFVGAGQIRRQFDAPNSDSKW